MSIFTERLSDIAAEAVMLHIRKELRQRIHEAIRPDIEEAIDAALVDFKIYAEGSHVDDVLRVLVERK